MADERIQYTDFVDGKQILAQWNADLSEMEKAVRKTFERIKSDAAGLFVDTSNPDKLAEDIQKLKKLVDELRAAKKAEDAVNKQLEQSETKLKAAKEATAQQVINNRVETQKLNREMQLQAKVATSNAGSINRLKAETNQLVYKLHELDQSTKTGRKQAKEWEKQINKNTNALKKADAAIGRHNRHVGNYERGLKNVGRQLLGAAGLISGVMLFTNAIKRAIQVTKEYHSALSSLQAITGVTAKEMAFFSARAKEMSKDTLKSVNEIIKAFERVGSIRPELLKNAEALSDVTEAAIILSESTGGMVSLEEAANATAGAMNQFEISSKDALLVVNTLAAGSKFGSATTQQLAESFKNFGAVAKNFNVSLEQSVALVEVAASKMILGAEAGTSIRNSILRLTQANLGYASGQFDINDAIDEFNANMESLGSNAEKDAYLLEVFGQKNITFGTILVNNKDKFNDLTKEVTGTTTALDQQAIQNDNLAGSITRMQNAWDRFLTSESKGANFLQTLADGVSMLLGADNKYDVRKKTEELKAYNLVLGYYNEMMVKTGSSMQSLLETDRIRGSVLKELGLTHEEYATALEKLKQQEAERVEAEKQATIEKKKQQAAEEEEVQTLATMKDELKQLREARELINTEDEQALILNYQMIEALQKQIKAVENLGEAQRKTYNLTKIDQKKAGPINLPVQTVRGASQVAGGQPPPPTDDFGLAAGTGERLMAGTNEMVEATRYSEDEIYEIKQAGVDAAFNLYDGFFNWMSNRRERQLQEVEKQRAAELEMAGDNIEAQEAINEKYDKKVTALKRKQARQDKLKAIFDIGINTAIGISKAIPNPFLIAFAALIGAVQLAVVASKPLPQFEKGVKSKKDSGWAIVNEGGEEMIIHPDGRVEMTSGGRRPELKYLEEGTEVVPNPEVQKRLAQMSDIHLKPFNERISTRRMEDLQVDSIDQQKRTNQLLERIKWSEGNKIVDMEGNTVTYV